MKAVLKLIRRFWKFAAVSLCLHLLIILGLSTDRPMSQGRNTAIPVQIVASSSGNKPELQPASKPSALPIQSAQEKHSKAVREKGHASLASVVPTPSYIRTETEGKTAPSEPARNAALENASASLASPAQDGITADVIRQYRLALIPEARRQKRYPGLARERGWQGIVEVTVKLNHLHELPALAVSRSSGYAVLDEQALAMLEQAVRLTAVPESLRGKDVGIAVPIRFSLED